MKKLKSFAVLCIASVLFSSCAHTLYSPEVMEYNYNMRMKSDKELTAKSQVRIFMSEKDVKGDYTVVSVNLYSPFRIPVFMSFRKQMSKKFYQKAVMKAQEQGGNGIIVTSAGMYKVINITAWNADDEGPATFVNVIFDKKLMNKFTSGEVSKSAKSAVRRYEASFCDEIALNVKSATTLEEVDVIKEKIAALKAYNASLSKPKSAIDKVIAKCEKSLVKVEKKIKKKQSK